MTNTAQSARAWSIDILPGFEQMPVGRATLVRPVRPVQQPRGVVLHVHGYNDYFFQEHLAAAFTEVGLAFFAVDLRRAGRSLRAGDIPHFMDAITEPGDDLDDAVQAIASVHPGLPLFVHAHSTGGLSATVWAADRPPAQLRGLVLDSPLFGRKEHGVKRLGPVLLPGLGKFRPLATVSTAPSVYAKHLHVEGGGRWEFDTSLKSPAGVPARAAWALAVLRAQQRIARGKLAVDVPVLVARAQQSGPERDDNPDIDSQDIVVDVAAISRLGARLGPSVTELVVEDGIHELSLSRTAAREFYVSAVTAWIDKVLA